ncbi:hypothetical protein [Saccharolobus islandicus]|uniref:hypothetical protein n=1 Tax=Saccharolobus islandicus TaxID=43080 RepID=UPI00163BA184|nr:hypothetical protein [Sulfolobus islandicus]
MEAGSYDYQLTKEINDFINQYNLLWQTGYYLCQDDKYVYYLTDKINFSEIKNGTVKVVKDRKTGKIYFLEKWTNHNIVYLLQPFQLKGILLHKITETLIKELYPDIETEKEVNYFINNGWVFQTYIDILYDNIAVELKFTDKFDEKQLMIYNTILNSSFSVLISTKIPEPVFVSGRFDFSTLKFQKVLECEVTDNTYNRQLFLEKENKFIEKVYNRFFKNVELFV